MNEGYPPVPPLLKRFGHGGGEDLVHCGEPANHPVCAKVELLKRNTQDWGTEKR